MVERRLGIWRAVFSLSFASPLICGCYNAMYPDTYDASDFAEFQYRIESDPPCIEMPSIREGQPAGRWTFSVCEATITRKAGEEYVVILAVSTDSQSDSPYLPERAMTDSEIGRMLDLFSRLRINRRPRPFCSLPLSPSFSGDVAFQWDDFRLVTYDCDRARLDWRQRLHIGEFLEGLLSAQPAAGSP